MKIAFIASIEGLIEYKQNYFTIINFFTTKGHHVSHILSKTKEQIIACEHKEREIFFQSFYKELRNCDLVIAECTLPTIHLGHDISLALQYGKEVVILKLRNNNLDFAEVHPLFSNNSTSVYEYDSYSLTNNLKKILELNPNQKYIKYNILLTPQLMEKLNIISRKRGIPKAVFIRQVLENSLSLEGM